jgi:hypothetical protein
MPRIQIPPIRTGLEDPDAADGGNAATGGRTAKEWYYFWQRSGEKLDGLVTYGKHANRPDPEGVVPVPDGALYLEQDRGSTFYQFQDGDWMYIAGTMWGTLSPDQRPADLTAPNDIGFEFWATDQTPVRKYVWSGSAWIEQTPAIYGTHAARLALTPANIAPGVLYVETDRNNVIYEMQKPAAVNVWLYVTGTMRGTISPDQRPGDLGTNDTGFRFDATDTLQAFAWNGTAWVNRTPNDAQYAAATGALTLTTTPTDVPGTALTLQRAGRYLIQGNFELALQPGDQGFFVHGGLNVDGTDLGSTAATLLYFSGTGTLSTITSQQWFYTAPSAGKIVKLRSWKTGGTGASGCGVRTTISAVWVGP